MSSFDTLLSGCKTQADARNLLKCDFIVDTPEKKSQVEALILTLKNKPKKWALPYKVNEKGYLVLCHSVAHDLDAIQSIIDALEKYKTDPAGRPYSRG